MIDPKNFRSWCESNGLDDLLLKYPALRLRPMRGSEVVIEGLIDFSARGVAQEVLEGRYQLEIRIPQRFPSLLPQVWEVGQQIATSFHKLQNGALCLGSETRLRLLLARSSSITSFVDEAVVPYLYGHSYFQRYGTMPFEELPHGREGVVEDLADIFGAPASCVLKFVIAISLRKRVANKTLCPCGNMRRLGRCHHGRVNFLRKHLGRPWFRHLRRTLSYEPTGHQ